MSANCWQVKKCGREIGGARAKELGVCSAATEKRLAGIHGGQNGGRACWVLTGTLCGGKVQGSYAAKLSNCMACEFYQQVQKEEAGRVVPSSKIFAILK
ncbi:MAG: hypothetical protein H6729_04775 [Deltaproteobacteria bacterium]|nr:hypothetical protein [Deltaproteobacteria bacterium]